MKYFMLFKVFELSYRANVLLIFKWNGNTPDISVNCAVVRIQYASSFSADQFAIPLELYAEATVMMTGKNKLHCTLLKWNRHSLATNLNQLQRLRLKTDEQSGSIQVENMQFDRSSLFPHFSYVSLTTCVTLALLCHIQFQYEPHESGAKNNYPNWQRCGIKSGTPKASGTFNDGQFRIKWTPAYSYRRNKHNGMVMELNCHLQCI